MGKYAIGLLGWILIGHCIFIKVIKGQIINLTNTSVSQYTNATSVSLEDQTKEHDVDSEVISNPEVNDKPLERQKNSVVINSSQKTVNSNSNLRDAQIPRHYRDLFSKISIDKIRKDNIASDPRYRKYGTRITTKLPEHSSSITKTTIPITTSLTDSAMELQESVYSTNVFGVEKDSPNLNTDTAYSSNHIKQTFMVKNITNNNLNDVKMKIKKDNYENKFSQESSQNDFEERVNTTLLEKSNHSLIVNFNNHSIDLNTSSKERDNFHGDGGELFTDEDIFSKTSLIHHDGNFKQKLIDSLLTSTVSSPTRSVITRITSKPTPKFQLIRLPSLLRLSRNRTKDGSLANSTVVTDKNMTTLPLDYSNLKKGNPADLLRSRGNSTRSFVKPKENSVTSSITEVTKSEVNVSNALNPVRSIIDTTPKMDGIMRLINAARNANKTSSATHKYRIPLHNRTSITISITPVNRTAFNANSTSHLQDVSKLPVLPNRFSFLKKINKNDELLDNTHVGSTTDRSSVNDLGNNAQKTTNSTSESVQKLSVSFSSMLRQRASGPTRLIKIPEDAEFLTNHNNKTIFVSNLTPRPDLSLVNHTIETTVDLQSTTETEVFEENNLSDSLMTSTGRLETDGLNDLKNKLTTSYDNLYTSSIVSDATTDIDFILSTTPFLEDADSTDVFTKIPMQISTVSNPFNFENDYDNEDSTQTTQNFRTTTTSPTSTFMYTDKQNEIITNENFDDINLIEDNTPREDPSHRILSIFKPIDANLFHFTNNTVQNKIDPVTYPSNVEIEPSKASDSLSTTTVYVVAIVGVIPAAGFLAWLARKMLKKRKRSSEESQLPDNETRVTHDGNENIISGENTDNHQKANQLFSEHDSKKCEVSILQQCDNKPGPWEVSRHKLRLNNILGEGHFGQVWKAEAENICGFKGTVLVAVKTVKDNATTKEKQDLLREMELMQKLGPHPNVVTLLGCCTKQEPHLLVMEYVMYGKLLTFLRDCRSKQNYYNFSTDTYVLTAKDVTMFGYHVAKGMEYIVSKGIIHRDIAARNILIDHNKVCKIADFGLSRHIKSMEGEIYAQRSKGALPIRWMAPESLYFSIFTHKSDVWSFGILMWEIVTLGSTPYAGMTAREVIRNVKEGHHLQRPGHCRSELYVIMSKCWDLDSTKRPEFSDLRSELGRMLDHAAGYIDLEKFCEDDYASINNASDEKV